MCMRKKSQFYLDIKHNSWLCYQKGAVSETLILFWKFMNNFSIALALMYYAEYYKYAVNHFSVLIGMVGGLDGEVAFLTCKETCKSNKLVCFCF